MQSYSLRHLPNHVLVRDLRSLVDRDRETTAALLAHIAEVDRRRLYADEAFGSMFDYCVRVLGFTEDMAGMRIRAARTARRFPVIFESIAEGRLTVTAVCLISKPVRNLDERASLELIAAAENKTKEEVRLMLAGRFPQPDLEPQVRAMTAHPTGYVLSPHVPERVEVQNLSGEAGADPSRPDALESPPPAPSSLPIAGPPPGHDRSTPLSPGRFGLQLTMSAETYEKWRRVEELLAPGVPRGDYAQRLDRALDALIEKLARQRFAATDRPRPSRPCQNDDHIPAAVKRAVHERDGGQCTFVSEGGKRCEERGDLEYDHRIPRARGGRATIENLRLRCFAHNQWEAERIFGAGFMQEKRDQARRARGPHPN